MTDRSRMSSQPWSRRTFLQRGAQLAGGAVLTPAVLSQLGATAIASRAVEKRSSAGSKNGSKAMSKKFEISIAAWSWHRKMFAGEIKQIDMPVLCRKEFDVSGLELVNTFFPSPQYSYCRDLRKRAEDHGVKILLIMCDGEGDMAHADKAVRKQAVRNHRKWLDVAAVLGCHSIRCNSGSGQVGDKEAIKRCAESFAELVEIAEPDGLNVIIENHGGLSSDPESLVAVMKQVDDPRFGTLPDFGNFPGEVDRYAAVAAMMPYAKAVSAKCHEFDESGNETRTDFAKMMKIVLDAGYNGYVGIEFEGPEPDENDGIRKCQRLLERFQ